jgi:hypothetical protein
MRKIVELTDHEIEEAREYGLNLKLRDEGLKPYDPESRIERVPIDGGTQFIQKG